MRDAVFGMCENSAVKPSARVLIAAQWQKLRLALAYQDGGEGGIAVSLEVLL